MNYRLSIIYAGIFVPACLTRRENLHIMKLNLKKSNGRKVCKPVIPAYCQGLVLVSTGVRKLEKPSVVGHYDKSSN